MMKKDVCAESKAATFDDVLSEELSLLDELRDDMEIEEGRSAYDNARASCLAGLAFSGGGIRSATFNLGIIQALARYGLLAKFDYLSTVSGGGYIGGWLSVLLHRKAGTGARVDQQAVEQFQARLEPHPSCSGKNKPDTTVGFPPVEHMAVRYLRCYSNYLSPKLGLSGDMLSVVSIGLRNFTLIQLALISLVASILLLAHLIAAGSAELAPKLQWLPAGLQQGGEMFGITWPAWFLSAASSTPMGLAFLGVLSMVVAGWSVRRLTQFPAQFSERRSKVERRRIDDQNRQVERRMGGDRRSKGERPPAQFGERRSEVERRRIDEQDRQVERRMGGERRTRDERRLVVNGHHDKERRRNVHKPPLINIAVNLRIMLPCLISAWAFSVAIAQLSALGDRVQDLPAMLTIGVPAMAATGYIIGWLLSYSDATPRKNPPSPRGPCVSLGDPPTSAARQGFTLLLATAVSGLILGLLLFAAIYVTAVSESATTIDIWHAVAFGPPLFLLALLFSLTIHIGAVRRIVSEHYREWLARLGGFQLLYATAWTLIFALVLYAAPLVHWLAGGGLAALGVWAGGSGAGVWLARSPATGGERNNNLWKDAVSRVAPWLFLGGLAIIVAYATHIALMEINIGAGYVRPLAEDFSVAAVYALDQLNDLSAMQISAALIVMAGLFLIIIRRFDINLFSLHALYCNRLARAYLGASRAGERTPNPFTGFDVRDDVPFHELARQRPIHIVNTAINLTGGDDLAWQTRRAASFAVTPCWAGFETRSTQGHRLGAYRRTRFYAGGRNFGTWIAVSGAAASPNMGYHTSPAVAALMTAFNLRLGRWCGNPVHADVWDKTSPRYAAKPILAELTGSATAQADWINLTDGGHFENLGVYELIRRRCRLILVTDAGCDPEHKFEDLANLLRKCWTDLGVNIRFESIDFVKLKDEKGICKAHCAIGRIDYTPKRKTDDKDDADSGVLIYLKASMTGDEWPDIRQYADNHKDFPHETTADQFFDENQFESYRHLGYKVMAKVHKHIIEKLKAKPDAREPKDLSVEELIDLLRPIMPSDMTSPQTPTTS